MTSCYLLTVGDVSTLLHFHSVAMEMPIARAPGDSWSSEVSLSCWVRHTTCFTELLIYSGLCDYRNDEQDWVVLPGPYFDMKDYLISIPHTSFPFLKNAI